MTFIKKILNYSIMNLNERFKYFYCYYLVKLGLLVYNNIKKFKYMY